jgi:hypothetical protein
VTCLENWPERCNDVVPEPPPRRWAATSLR